MSTTKEWVVGGAVYINISEYELILAGTNNPVTNTELYSGSIDFSGNPISIITLANRILTTAFSLNIKDIFPAGFDILFNSFSGTISIKPQKGFLFNASSQLTLPNPFGLTNKGIDFKELNLAINYKEPLPPVGGGAATVGQKIITISATVVNNIPSSAIVFGNAQITFANGETAFGFQIQQQIDPAAILESIFSITIPPDVKSFLPIFKPQSSTQPIRLYKSTNDFSYVDDSKPVPQTISFVNGFHLDQLVIQVLKYDFLVGMSIVNSDFSIAAHAPVIDLIPGFLKLTKPNTDPAIGFGTELIIDSKTSSIALNGELVFFSNEPVPTKLDYSFSYLKNTKEFLGNVTYIGTIIGETNPSLGFSWSDANGFRITKFPIDTNKLTTALNWADQLKKLSNLSADACEKACGDVVELAFKEAIQTTFNFKFAPQKSTTPGQVVVIVSGTYSITVLGNKVDDIVFDAISLEFVLPKSFDTLSTAILQSLEINVDLIAKGLWDNKAQLAEVLSFLTLVKGGKVAVCKLACRAGEEAVKKLMEDAIDAAANAAAEAALSTLAEAATAIVAASSLLDLIGKFISWLFGKTAKQKADEATAQKKIDDANLVIQQKLTIPNFNVSYNEGLGNLKNIATSWTDCPAENSLASGSIYYKLSYNCTGVSQSKHLDRSTLSYTIYKPDLKNGQTYSLSIQACYIAGDRTLYEGLVLTKSLNTPILATPIPSNIIDWTLGNITVNWPQSAIQGSVYVTGYQIQLMDLTTNLPVLGKQITITGGSFLLPPATTCIIKLYSNPNKDFIPNPLHSYAITIQAIASDPDLNSLFGTSTPFNIQWGIGYMSVDSNFKID